MRRIERSVRRFFFGNFRFPTRFRPITPVDETPANPAFNPSSLTNPSTLL
jgi:hypothetical protein